MKKTDMLKLAIIGLMVGSSALSAQGTSRQAPAASTKPIHSHQPVKPIGPAQPIKPPVNPPEQPIKPIEPVQPVKPIEPIAPIQPVKPIAPSN